MNQSNATEYPFFLENPFLLVQDAVEYYDSIKDQISSYFIYKIQDTLATKKSLKVLIKENAHAKANHNLAVKTDGKDSQDSSDPAGTPSTAGESPNKPPVEAKGLPPAVFPPQNVILETLETSEDDEEEEPKFAQHKANGPAKVNKMMKKSVNVFVQTRNRRTSFNTMKTVKQKIFAHTMVVETHKKNEKQNLTQTLNAFGGYVQNNDNVVKSDIDVQKSRIQERVARKSELKQLFICL